MRIHPVLNPRLSLALAASVCNALFVQKSEASHFTNTGSLNTRRSGHSATLLPNGKVLIAGGSVSSTYLSSPEIYDPISGTWTNAGALNSIGSGHTATLLPNGLVLIAGGSAARLIPPSHCELYDPMTGDWTNTGDL